MKKILLLCILNFVSVKFISQTVGKFKYKDKIYNVFPYRLSNTEDIPSLGLKIPDGEYIAFSTYNFKQKMSLKNTKKYVLTDTTVIAAIFNVKNNAADGKAIFYKYSYKSRDRQTKKPTTFLSGNFADGLKQGPWVSQSDGKPPFDISEFKNGVKNGYSFDYTSSGKISKKTKYCDGFLCDTTFEYSNGMLQKEYDFYSGYVNKDELTIYDKALQDYDSGIEDIKTYYKEYNYNGKLILDLKFNNGKVLPFDSIGETYSSGTYLLGKYITIKKLPNDKKIIRSNHFYVNEKRVREMHYEGDFLSYDILTDYKTRLKKKKFSKKRIVLRVDSYPSSTYYLNPKLVNQTSIKPICVESAVRFGDTTSEFYIPRYKFLYKEKKNYRLGKIDTINQRIYLTEKKKNWSNFKKYSRITESMYINEDQKDSIESITKAFQLKSFLIDHTVESFSDDFDKYREQANDYKTDQFYSIETKKTYYKNDTLLNGNYCFSDCKKPKKWLQHIVHVGYTYFESNFSQGAMMNGLKDGPWQTLDIEEDPKKTPLSFKNYFYKHPKNVKHYYERVYKNGLLDGHCIYNEKYDPKEDDRNSREPIVLYKEIDANFTRDTLNGPYKDYFSNGKIRRETNFIMGSPDGEFKEYSDDGKLYATIQFKKGKLEGRYVEYNGEKITQYAFFQNNVLKDSVVYYYPNTKPRMAIYVNQELLQKKLTYFFNGKLKEEVTFNADSKSILNEDILSSESFIEILRNNNNPTMDKSQGYYKNYYDNGQLLSEGSIRNGKLFGNWKFYSINGTSIHEVNFVDTLILLPSSNDSVNIAGFYNGFYSNGAKRCNGYIKNLDLSYDCFTKQDKADLDFYSLNYFDINGKQLLKNGNGYFTKYDANGLRVSSGKLINCLEDSLWRYYTPEQKLNEIGHYVDFEKDGVWYEGDLEGVNFEDGACFDLTNKEEEKEFISKQKDLRIAKIIYRNGSVLDRIRFDSNLNKTYKPRRRGRTISHPNF
jgi:antitoxin component YwqK of YwqJK toxin-antitoxin module